MINSPSSFLPWSLAKRILSYNSLSLVKIAPAFTKDAPNGLPEMKQIKVKGKVTWDDSDMTEFLENVAKECFAKIATASTNDEVFEGEEAPF